MSPEYFIQLFNHLPNIYPDDDNIGYCVRPYSFSGYDVPYCWNANIEAVLESVATNISKVTGITYLDTETSGADINDSFFDWASIKVRVSKTDIGFLEQLWKLNPASKIAAMQLNETQLEEFLIESKQMLLKYVKQKLKKNWYFRESGEMVRMDNYLDKGGLTLEKIQKRIKSKTITRNELEYFVDLFNELKGEDEA